MSFLARLFGFGHRTNQQEQMPSPGRLIVGLGNPGPDYEGTRHNIGFEVIDAIARDRDITLTHEKGDVLGGSGRFKGRTFAIAKPMTFMNRSGKSVLALMRRFNLQPDNVLVVYDDISLPQGRIRLRQGGSAGGHNGVQDIIDQLRTDAFPRLRLGIGSEFSRGRQAEYVLSPFLAEERIVMDEAVVRARDASLLFVTEGIVTAMNRSNR
jgi:peptidyl-tRNA hydrolase, PTH1 family